MVLIICHHPRCHHRSHVPLGVDMNIGNILDKRERQVLVGQREHPILTVNLAEEDRLKGVELEKELIRVICERHADYIASV